MCISLILWPWVCNITQIWWVTPWQCSCELKPLATGQGLVSTPWESDRLDPAPPRELINRWQKALTPGAAGLPAPVPGASSLQLCISSEQLTVCCLYVVIYSAYNCELFIRFIIQTRMTPFFLCLALAVFDFSFLNLCQSMCSLSFPSYFKNRKQ